MMPEREGQRLFITFCVKLQHSTTETIMMIQEAFGDSALSAIQIKVWHKLSKDGRESVGVIPFLVSLLQASWDDCL